MVQATQLVGIVPPDVLASMVPDLSAETAFAEVLNALAVCTNGASLSLNSAHPNSPPARGETDGNSSDESSTDLMQLATPVCVPVPVLPVAVGITPIQTVGSDVNRSELPVTLPDQAAPVLVESESSTDIASVVSNMPNESDSEPPDIHPTLPDLAPTTDTTKASSKIVSFPANEKFPSGELHRDEASIPQQTMMQPEQSSVVRVPNITDEKVSKVPPLIDLMRVVKPKESQASTPAKTATSAAPAARGSSPESNAQKPTTGEVPAGSHSSDSEIADFELAAPERGNHPEAPKHPDAPSRSKAPSTKAPELNEAVQSRGSINELGFQSPQPIVLETKSQLNHPNLASHSPASPAELETSARTPELPEQHPATGKTPERTVDAPVTPGAVHLLTRVERQEMRFGWNTPDFGRIEVHTTVERDRVAATVAVPDLRMRESLQAESALLGRALADRALELGNFQTLDSGAQSDRRDANPNHQDVAPQWHLPRSGSAIPPHAKVRSTYHIGALDLRA